MPAPSLAIPELSGAFYAHTAVRAVLQSAFRGALKSMEDAGFETETIAGLVQLADAGKPGLPWALLRQAVLRDPCTDNYVQICTGLSIVSPAGRPAYAAMRLQLHELDLPVPEYGEPKSVLADVSLYEVSLPAPVPGQDQQSALNAMVQAFTNGDDPAAWAGEETQNLFKNAFEVALLP